MAELPVRMDALSRRFTGLAYRVDQRVMMMVTNLTNMAVTHRVAHGALDCFVEQGQRLKPAEVHGRHLLGRPPFATFGGGLPDVAARPRGAALACRRRRRPERARCPRPMHALRKAQVATPEKNL